MGSPRLESWLCPLPGEEPSIQCFRALVWQFCGIPRTGLCWGTNGALYKECLEGSRCLMDFSWPNYLWTKAFILFQEHLYPGLKVR